MKKIFLITLLILCLNIVLTSCFGKDEGSDEEEIQERKETEFQFSKISSGSEEFDGKEGYKLTSVNLGDDTDLVIPSTYNDKPVLMIESRFLHTEDKDRITSISVPKSVEKIEKKAFYECTNLKSVVFEEGINIKVIEANMFYGCTSLEIIEMPESVQEIGSNAFYGCSKLSDVIISSNSSLKKIGHGAFHRCESLKYIYLPGTVYQVEIPFDSNIEGIFYGNRYYSGAMYLGVKEEKVHEYISGRTNDGFVWKKIGEQKATIYKYLGTETELNEINEIEGNIVTAIEDFAFKDCEKITKIIIPDTVDRIGEGAFENCRSLKSITIPKKVGTIESYTFSGCSAIETIEIKGEIAKVGDNAFADCVSLTSLTSGEDGTSVMLGEICDSAFRNCESLEELSINITANIISEIYKGENGGFIGTGNIGDIVGATGSVTIEIGEYAFSDCDNLKSFNVSLPYFSRSTIKLGKCAFSNCVSIETVTIPSIEQIGSYAFSGCESLKNLKCNSKGYDEIEEGAFSNCKSLQTFYFSGITKIGKEAFLNCNSLTSVDLSGMIEIIEPRAFAGCTSIESVTIPAQIKTVGSETFSKCTGIKSVVIEGGGVSADAFAECELESLTIPVSYLDKRLEFMCSKTLTITGSGVLSNGGNHSINVESLIISEGITQVGKGALQSFKFKSITIPKTLTKFGESAFDYEHEKFDVFYLGDVAGWCSIDFPNENSNPLSNGGRLYIGEQMVSTLIIPDTISEVNNYAFVGCASIESIKFEGENLYISLGDYAFYKCSGMKEVELPKGVITIGSRCFSYSSITEFVASEDLKKINFGAFEHCFSLKKADIKGVISIDTSSFDGCSSLENVELGVIQSIGHGAFAECKKLGSILLPETVAYIGSGAFVDGVRQVVFEGNYKWKYTDENGTWGTTYASSITLTGLNALGRVWERVS